MKRTTTSLVRFTHPTDFPDLSPPESLYSGGQELGRETSWKPLTGAGGGVRMRHTVVGRGKRGECDEHRQHYRRRRASDHRAFRGIAKLARVRALRPAPRQVFGLLGVADRPPAAVGVPGPHAPRPADDPFCRACRHRGNRPKENGLFRAVALPCRQYGREPFACGRADRSASRHPEGSDGPMRPDEHFRTGLGAMAGERGSPRTRRRGAGDSRPACKT